MSELLGFKYTADRGSTNNCIEYIILSASQKRYYIDMYQNGEKHHFDITDSIDEFCIDITNLHIENWNMNSYNSQMDWFPPADYWTLQLKTDTIVVSCRGQGEYPPNWNDFWQSFYKMCNSKSKPPVKRVVCESPIRALY